MFSALTPAASTPLRIASSSCGGVGRLLQTLVLMPTMSVGLMIFFQAARRLFLAKQRFHGFVQHPLHDIGVDGAVLIENILVADQHHPGFAAAPARRAFAGQARASEPAASAGGPGFDELTAADGLFFHSVPPLIPYF